MVFVGFNGFQGGFMVFMGFGWFPWFFEVVSWFIMIFGWFPWFFKGGIMVYHGFWLVYMVLLVENTTKQYPGPTIQSRPALA